MRNRRSVAVVLALAMATTACSGSFTIGGQSVDTAAEGLIAGDLAEALEFGELEPNCPVVEDPEVGTTFSCTATTEDGTVIEFDGVVDREDHIDLQATNVANAPVIAATLYESLSTNYPEAALDPASVDCGDGPVVLDNNRLTCQVTAPGGTTDPVVVTVNDLDTVDISFDYQPPVPPPVIEDEQAGGDLDFEAVGRSVLLTIDDLGDGWTEAPQTESTVDYSLIDGCQPIADLRDRDGHLVDVDSPEFASGDITVTHSVRIYPSDDAATAVVLAWAEQLAVDCVVTATEIFVNEAGVAGELDPYTEYNIDLQAYEDLAAEPRITNLELSTVLSATEEPNLIVINDQYFIQVGPMVSSFHVQSQDALWENTEALLDLVVNRMVEIDTALSGG